MCEDLVSFIRQIYKAEGFIPLHEPRFMGNERKYVLDAIDSTFVSSVGVYVDLFEQEFAKYIDAKNAVACVNGTAALHMALILAGVRQDDEVITQPLTFIATCNAIKYQNAYPVFVDVDRDTMGMSPASLSAFLEQYADVTDKGCVNKKTGRVIRAVVPMHTFGHACRIDEIAQICKKWGIVLVEDAAEALGSTYKGKALGSFGDIAAFSFNGNKVVTTGGGGMVVCKDAVLSQRAKYLTTTAKKAHPFEFFHDEIGYNYRMPNLNAALGCAQLEQMRPYLENKRNTAMLYRDFFEDRAEEFVNEPLNAKSNFWLNAILLKDKTTRDRFLIEMNSMDIMTRPVWTLMNKLPMFKECQAVTLTNAYCLEDRVVNLPSSVLI